MAQRIFQDPAGTIPAILAGQPVGLVKRMAGTVDATQATPLSKPTLARWPMNGRRNLATGAQAVGVPAYWVNSATSNGVVVTKLNSGVDPTDGLPFVDYRYVGTPTAGSVATAFANAGSIVPAQSGDPFSARMSVMAIAGSLTGVTGAKAPVAMLGAGGAYLSELGTTVPLALDEWKVCSVSGNLTRPETEFARTAAVIFATIGTPIDVNIRFKGLQFERGLVQTPLQFNYGPNDITEPGVADLWHLYNDGGDSLACVLPAGTYGVANLAIDRSYRIDTLVSDGSTPITTLTSERQIDAIYRFGEFSPAEQLAIVQYWEKEYML